MPVTRKYEDHEVEFHVDSPYDDITPSRRNRFRKSKKTWGWECNQCDATGSGFKNLDEAMEYAESAHYFGKLAEA